MSPSKSKSVEAKILPRRFDLIKKMYLSDKVIAANKKDLIFNWFFEQFGNFQNDTTLYTCELLWKTYFEILAIEKTENNGQRILIKSSAITNLLDSINYSFSNSWLSVILSSTSTFLQTSTINAVLIADVDKLFLLLFATLKIICKIYECDNDDSSSLKEAKELANIILDILENLPASNEEIKATLITNHLQSVATFMHIASNDLKLENLSMKLSNKIIGVVFNLKKKSFETLLTSLESDQFERPHPVLLNFFSHLQILLMNEAIAYHSFSVSTTCGTLLKKLLSSFLEQNKSSFISLKVVSLFFAVAGFDIPILFSVKSCCKSLFEVKSLNFNPSILGVNELLEACLTVPQYFTSVSAPEGYLRPSIWLKGMTATLLDMKISKNKILWLNCFCSLLMISPSIVESDILLLIKTALLKISLHSKDSKKQYCELFSIVLRTHSKLHQVPKFFVKLLLALTECIKENSGGNFLVNGQILAQTQEAVARCVQELPYGQMIELWRIFIETYSTLENMSETFMVSKGYVFFVAQLFSTFLIHAQLFQANIPSNINSQFKKLIENTYNEIRKSTPILRERDSKVAPLQSSVLLLLHTIGEVKLLFICNHDKFFDTSEITISEEVFDFSILQTWSDEDFSSVLETYMKSDNKILSFLVFQLLLQKIRVLDFYTKFSQGSESSSEKCANQMQKTVSVILQYIKECSTASESWDSDICSINANNYGTAYWMTYLKISRLVLNYLTPKDVYDFCCSIQNIILQDYECKSGAKFFILSSLKNGDFEDFRHFQTAFVSAIWKQENFLSCKKRSFDDMEAEESIINKIFTFLTAYKSKSMKYAERTPKSNKKLGSMWDQIKEVSDCLNHILLTEVLPKDKLIISNTKNLLKIFSCLPLKYLLPGNQMKSIIGLSAIFFLVPQSCKPNDAVSLCKEISHQLLTIFDGARSIWLFDFVTSGPYLKFVVRTVEFVIYNESENSDWTVQLIERLVFLAVRSVGSLSNLENCISELATQNKCSRSSLITLYTLLRKFLQVLQHQNKQENYRETLIKVSLLALKGFINHMKMNFKDSMENVDHCYSIKCYIQAIEIVCSCSELENMNKECLAFLPSVLEKAINITTNSSVEVLGDVYLLFISKICKHASKLSAFLPKDFVSVSWKIVFAYFEAKLERMMKSFEFNQNLKNVFLGPSCIPENKFCEICSFYAGEVSTKDNGKNREQCNIDEKSKPFSLNEFEEESLKELSVITSPEALSEVFQRLLTIMDAFGSAAKNIFSLQISILMLQCLIDVNTKRCIQPLLNNLVQKCLSRLNFIVNTMICCSSICQTVVLIPILEFISFIITGNKGLPKHVLLQNLQCVVPVSLEVQENNYKLFVTSFNAVWKVVYNLFMHHTQVIVASTVPAPFLYYVGKLLKSLVRAGAEVPLSKCDTNTFQQVQLCGQNMNRLLTVISRNKNDFSKLAPYLVAEYVDAIQHITLDSKIKESILLGIYRLLDICSEESIKMLAVNLNYVCREIYMNLVKNYRQNKQITVS